MFESQEDGKSRSRLFHELLSYTEQVNGLEDDSDEVSVKHADPGSYSTRNRKRKDEVTSDAHKEDFVQPDVELSELEKARRTTRTFKL